jgi:hypothetical protein
MPKRQREVFLTTLLSDLLSQYPQWRVDDHCKIEWMGQPKNMWPEADLLIDTATRRFIVEYDEDSDPSRSLTKYWPIVHQTNQVPLTVIEVWKRGPTIGRGYAEVTKWMAARLMELYPTFVYEFIERKDETTRIIAKRIARIVEAGYLRQSE